MYRALVVGGNHQNTLGVIQALGRKGVSSDVIIIGNESSSYVLSSKYILSGYICRDEVSVVSCIQDLLISTKQNFVAIACSDDAADILDRNFQNFQDSLVIPTVGERGTLHQWTNKEKMSNTAMEVGLTIPVSWLIKDKEIPSDMLYPCIVKPITSIKNGKKGFAKCYNEEELRTYLEFDKGFEPIQVQQYIDKDFEYQFIGCSINGGEEVIIPGRTHINTTTGFNNLVFLGYDKYEESFERIVECSKQFVKRVGYSGLFSIEFMRGKDGRDYFLEMNFRNDGNGIVVTSSGTNLPYIWYLYASGRNYMEEVSASVVRKSYMMPEVSFLLSMFNGEITFREWLSDYKKATCFLTRFDDDREPYKLYIRSQRGCITKSFVKYILVKMHLYNLMKKLKRRYASRR